MLLGHRPNDEIGELLAATLEGWGDVVGAHGSYVCGSAKEEFGLAIVEALAAGLPVTAPRIGGPATYVVQGTTGFLVDTMDPSAIAVGVGAALDLALAEGTPERARASIERRYSIDRMANVLAAVYRTALAPHRLAAPVATTRAA